MTENLDFADSRKVNYVSLAFGTAVALLMLTIVGSLVGLVSYRAIDLVHRRANPALGIAALALNVLSVLIVLALLSTAIHRAVNYSLLQRNVPTLRAASLVTIILLFQAIYGFVASEARVLIVVQIANLTHLDFLDVPWSVVPSILLPILALFAILIAAPRWSSATSRELE